MLYKWPMALTLMIGSLPFLLFFFSIYILMLFGNWVGPINIEQIQGLFLKKYFVLLLTYTSNFSFFVIEFILAEEHNLT